MVSDEKVQDINNFKSNHPYTFTYLRAINGFEKINVRPTTLIYNKKGVLVMRRSGDMSDKDLSDALKQLD